MNIDQMLAQAQLDNSNILMGFRSDAVIAHETALAAAPKAVWTYAVLDKHGREQFSGSLAECQRFSARLPLDSFTLEFIDEDLGQALDQLVL